MFRATQVSLAHLDPTVSFLFLGSRKEQTLAGLSRTVLVVLHWFYLFLFIFPPLLFVGRLPGPFLCADSLLKVTSRGSQHAGPWLVLFPSKRGILLVYYLNLLSKVRLPFPQVNVIPNGRNPPGLLPCVKCQTTHTLLACSIYLHPRKLPCLLRRFHS